MHYSRAEWGARPSRPGPGDLDPGMVQGVAFHHPGSGPIHGKAHVIRALQAWQRQHQDDKGWSDIAYQLAIDQDGNRWELRGLRRQSGANGDQRVNQRYGAVLLIVGNDEAPSEAMVREARMVVADFRRLYRGADAIVGHRDIRPDPTACPGNQVMDLIHAGEFQPREDDDMTKDELLDALESDRGQKVLSRALGETLVGIPSNDQDDMGKAPQPLVVVLTRLLRLTRHTRDRVSAD